jgi:predicted amidohydrolase YtcJ
VIVGAPIVTMDPRSPRAEAVALRGGDIVFVGSRADVERRVGPDTERLELAGGMVLPGFQDAHAHPVMSGVEVNQCDLAPAGDREQLFALLADCAARQDGEWLLGTGWALPLFPGANPRAEWLEEIAPGRPALLVAADGHSAWASRRALEIAGIDATTADPPRGRIERDPVTGQVTGTLREAAVALVGEHVPPVSLEERLAGHQLAQRLFLEHGVVAANDANVYPEHLEAYRAADAVGELALRVVVSLHTDPARGPEQVDDLIALRDASPSDRLLVTSAKLFVDGVVEARTALMLDPYDDRPGDVGSPEWEPERLHAVARRLVDEGFDLHFHAIGDGAVRQALDAVEYAEAGRQDRRSPRHHVAHLQVIHPDDIPRFAALDVGANFQALWAHADTYIVDLTWPGLGPQRSQWMYPIGSVHRAGGRLVFGSDWSVSSLDPLEAIEVALTRLGPDGEGDEPLLPDEAIDLQTALEAYTIGAAWANRLDDDSGSIEVGKRADLVLLSDDLFALPPERISDVRVLRTIIAGEDVYVAPRSAE